MKLFRFLYLNCYALVLAFLGLALLCVPLFKISPWFLAVQIPGAIKIFMVSFRLWGAWPDKKRMMVLLLNKNKNQFNPESFKLYMQAPCSRLLVKSVLKQLGAQKRYRELFSYRGSLFSEIKKNLTPVRTRVYIYD
jgi:hypothetical protein